MVKQINFSGSYATDGKIMKNNINHVLSDCNWKDEDSKTLKNLWENIDIINNVFLLQQNEN